MVLVRPWFLFRRKEPLYLVVNPSPYSTEDSITNNELLKKSNPENTKLKTKTLLVISVKSRSSAWDVLLLRSLIANSESLIPSLVSKGDETISFYFHSSLCCWDTKGWPLYLCQYFPIVRFYIKLSINHLYRVMKCNTHWKTSRFANMSNTLYVTKAVILKMFTSFDNKILKNEKMLFSLIKLKISEVWKIYQIGWNVHQVITILSFRVDIWKMILN